MGIIPGKLTPPPDYIGWKEYMEEEKKPLSYWIKAFEDGETVEAIIQQNDGWVICSNIDTIWHCKKDNFPLRIKPEQKLIPWTMEDVPMPSTLKDSAISAGK